jgi:hypothetical protein
VQAAKDAGVLSSEDLSKSALAVDRLIRHVGARGLKEFVPELGSYDEINDIYNLYDFVLDRTDTDALSSDDEEHDNFAPTSETVATHSPITIPGSAPVGASVVPLAADSSAISATATSAHSRKRKYKCMVRLFIHSTILALLFLAM